MINLFNTRTGEHVSVENKLLEGHFTLGRDYVLSAQQRKAGYYGITQLRHSNTPRTRKAGKQEPSAAGHFGHFTKTPDGIRVRVRSAQ